MTLTNYAIGAKSAIPSPRRDPSQGVTTRARPRSRTTCGGRHASSRARDVPPPACAYAGIVCIKRIDTKTHPELCSAQLIQDRPCSSILSSRGTMPFGRKPASLRSTTGDSFTERVRKVLAMARKEASQRGRSSVGTEHILLGLIREGAGVGAAGAGAGRRLRGSAPAHPQRS